ncbi:MAG: hypothetical protein QOI72_1277 [Solirubrobacterales bacterium]|nr:hypothetical protein [Solirubrobacterales bacterium]
MFGSVWGSDVWEHGAMRRVPLPVADALALMLFVVAGIVEHDEGTNVAALFLRNAVPLLASWFVVARFTGAYRRPGLRTLLLTWAIAVPSGLLLRTVWVGSPSGGELAVFLAVGLAFTALFLLAARLAARTLAGKDARSTPDVVR